MTDEERDALNANTDEMENQLNDEYPNLSYERKGYFLYCFADLEYDGQLREKGFFFSRKHHCYIFAGQPQTQEDMEEPEETENKQEETAESTDDIDFSNENPNRIVEDENPAPFFQDDEEKGRAVNRGRVELTDEDAQRYLSHTEQKDIQDINALYEDLKQSYFQYENTVYRYANSFESIRNFHTASIRYIFEIEEQSFNEENPEFYFKKKILEAMMNKEINLDFMPETNEDVITEFHTRLREYDGFVRARSISLDEKFRTVGEWLGEQENNLFDTYRFGRKCAYTYAPQIMQQLHDGSFDANDLRHALSDAIEFNSKINEDGVFTDFLEGKYLGKLTHLGDAKWGADIEMQEFNTLSQEYYLRVAPEKLKIAEIAIQDFLESSNSYKKQDDEISSKEMELLRCGLYHTMLKADSVSVQIDGRTVCFGNIVENSQKYDYKRMLNQCLIGLHEYNNYALDLGNETYRFKEDPRNAINVNDDFCRRYSKSGYQTDVTKQDWYGASSVWMHYQQGKTALALEGELKILQQQAKEAQERVERCKEKHGDNVARSKSFQKANADLVYTQCKIERITAELSYRSKQQLKLHEKLEQSNGLGYDPKNLLGGPSGEQKYIGSENENQNARLNGKVPPLFGNPSIDALFAERVENLMRQHADLLKNMDWKNKCALVPVIQTDENGRVIDAQPVIIASPKLSDEKGLVGTCTCITENDIKADKPFVNYHLSTSLGGRKGLVCEDTEGFVYNASCIIPFDQNSEIARSIANLLSPDVINKDEYKRLMSPPQEMNRTAALPERTNGAEHGNQSLSVQRSR